MRILGLVLSGSLLGLGLVGCERCAEPNAGFRVEVVDEAGLAFEGATLTLDGEPCEEPVTGEFDCFVEAAGPHELLVTAEGYADHAETVTAVEGGDPKCPSYDTELVEVALTVE